MLSLVSPVLSDPLTPNLALLHLSSSYPNQKTGDEYESNVTFLNGLVAFAVVFALSDFTYYASHRIVHR